MVEAKVVFDGDFIYCFGLLIQKGSFSYFVENSEGCVVLDCASLEECVDYCLRN